ncbi:MAG: hypothetical protein LBV16_03485 [Elusimicrobiota bacterium]|jgi:predicted RNase H-like HicB family nuclease|nr:hypothetical protein [Elusimicrobiota bacterium]
MAKIIAQNNNIISASVPVYFFKVKGDKNDLIYVECPSLNIFSHGETLTNAKKMFKEAFDCWLSVAKESGIANELKGLGWQVTTSTAFPKDEIQKVPIELFARQTVSLQIPIGV